MTTLRLRRRSGKALVVAFGVLAAATTTVAAKDLQTLGRVLYAIDLAEFLTNVCRLGEPSFLAVPLGPLGSVHDYQLHIKGEVLAGLDRDEATAVLKAAADRARADTRADLKPFESDGQLARDPFVRWCADSALPFVRKVVHAHDNAHAEIDQVLGRAKQPSLGSGAAAEGAVR